MFSRNLQSISSVLGLSMDSFGYNALNAIMKNKWGQMKLIHSQDEV